MSHTSTEKEIQCVVHWFQGWSQMQRGDFMKELLDKAIPCHLDSLFDSLRFMNVQDRPPSIFQCQINLFNQWFDGWSQQDKNNFMIKLREVNSEFVNEFDRLFSIQISMQTTSASSS